MSKRERAAMRMPKKYWRRSGWSEQGDDTMAEAAAKREEDER